MIQYHLLVFCILFFVFNFVIYILLFYTYIYTDIITRLRNRNLIKFSKVYVLQTSLSISIFKLLKDEGYIHSFKLNYLVNNILFLSICLKFKGLKKKSSISFIKRISKPGFRVYIHSFEIPLIEGGIGLSVFYI